MKKERGTLVSKPSGNVTMRRFPLFLLVGLLFALTLWLYVSRPESPLQLSADTFSRIVSSGELRVGFVVVPPWIIKDPNTGELSGSSVDAIREIGRLADLRVSFVEATWTTFISGLQTGQYDVSIVPSYITVGRAKAVNFTRPISYTGNTVLVRADETRFQNLADLDKAGVTIVVAQGTQDHEFAEHNFTQATIRPVPTQDIALLFTEVVTKRADVALADVYNINGFVRNNPSARNLFPNAPYQPVDKMPPPHECHNILRHIGAL